MTKFYYAKGTCALAAHLVLEEAGAHYEAHCVDFAASEQRSAAYLAINPLGRVPALITDQGVLTETPAILVWIAQTHPERNLALMNDPFRFARVQSFNSYLASTVHVAHAHKTRGARWTDDPAAQAALTRQVPQTMTRAFELIEQAMPDGPWVMGEDFTVSDAYLFTLARWLEGDSVDIATFPKVQAHFERMKARPVTSRVLSLHIKT